MKLPKTNSQTLLSYSALAAAFFATSAEADAQTGTPPSDPDFISAILHYDYDPDSVVLPEVLVVNYFSYYSSSREAFADIDLDLTRDGVVDATMSFDEESWFTSTGGFIIARDAINPLSPKLAVARYLDPYNGEWMAAALSDGEVVDNFQEWQTGRAVLLSSWTDTSSSATYGEWKNFVTKSLGLRYEISPGNYMYGWMRMNLRRYGDMAKLYEIMWSVTPNSPITVGAAAPIGDCARPTALNATVLSPTTATLSWTADPTAVKNQIEGKKEFFTNFGRVLENDNNRTFMTLSPGTNYEWRVRSICSSGLVSPATAISTFSTPTIAAADRNGQQKDLPANFDVKTYTDHGRLIIESDQTIESYALYNVAGSMLQSGFVNAQQLVASTNYPAGIYLVEVQINGQAIWSKFHVE